jgi:hypothetical protein
VKAFVSRLSARRPSWSRIRVALFGLAAAALIAAVTTAVVVRRHPYGQAVLWTALVLASFVGWGSILNHWIARKTRLDWGLRAGWGMSFSILVGGFLCLAHLATRFVLVGQVALGLAGLWGDWLARSRRAPSASRLRRRLVVAFDRFGLIALVVGGYAGVVLFVMACFGDHAFQPSDDPTLYMTLPEKLMQTGSMLEPFAARRMPILGGHVYLQAIFLAVGSPYYLYVVDGGLCVAIAVGLLVGQVKGSGLKDRHIVPLALVFLLFFGLRCVRVNTGSIYSGVVGIVTLYRTARVSLGGDLDRPVWPIEIRRVVLLAAFAAVTILLRSSLAGDVLPFAVLLIASDFVRGNRQPWKGKTLLSLLRVLAVFAIVVVVGVLPWSILLRQSCGTFFYPLGHTNLTPGLSFLAHKSGTAETLSRFVTTVLFAKPVAGLLAFLIAGLVPLAGRSRNDLVALTLATTICLATLTRSAFGAQDTARYCFAAVATAALITVGSAGRNSALATLAGLAVAVHLAMSFSEWSDVMTLKITQAHAAYAEKESDRAAWDSSTSEYLEVQSHVPPGATMVTVVRESFRFDFRRNKIFALDALGAMGPKPGWPAHKGPEALARYLRHCGVDYVVRVDFNEPGELYNRAHWRENLARKDATISEWAVFQLDAEDALDGLSKVRKDVFVGHGMTVVDLRAH